MVGIGNIWKKGVGSQELPKNSGRPLWTVPKTKIMTPFDDNRYITLAKS